KAEAHQVRRFINSLPHELGPKSPYRMGAKLYKESHKDFKLRSTAHIPAGFLYNGDGHTLDVYLAHHKSGNPFRYELTALQDVRSRKIVAWDLSEAENTLATLNALITSIKKYDHLVSMFYVDNGSGYKANMMSDECIGVYAQLDIEPIFAIPGNARAKWIERFFLHMEDRVGKRFQTYCGRHEDESFKKLVLKEIKQGKRHLPTIEEWVAEFNKFLDHYHSRPHPEETGKTRQQVWDENFVQSKPPHIDFDFLPKAKVKVRRGQIQLHKRTYTADYLHQFNGQELIAGFSMTDDKTIKLHELTGELLLIAHLKTKVPAIPESRIEQRRDERTKFQLKRLDKKKYEILAQAAKTHVVDVNEVEELAADTGPQSIEQREPTQFFEMDLNDFLVEPEQSEVIDLTDFAVTEDDE
ncbi:transposase family protein, partial [Pseudoalteromonas rubra]|uniref:transposase family protein n=1 Tax=Pseudoalteromonas rubra TaxID=43658 RepID=UPI002DB63044